MTFVKKESDCAFFKQVLYYNELTEKNQEILVYFWKAKMISGIKLYNT